jgi:hypothetical protein
MLQRVGEVRVNVSQVSQAIDELKMFSPQSEATITVEFESSRTT